MQLECIVKLDVCLQSYRPVLPSVSSTCAGCKNQLQRAASLTLMFEACRS